MFNRKKQPKPPSDRYTNLEPRKKAVGTLKRGKGLSPLGKNRLGILKRKWNAEWHKEFEYIHWCESCGQPDGIGDSRLTQMHAVKQRFITTEAECKRAAKVCWGEHRKFDFATGENVHEKMAGFVDNLIMKRTVSML